jgi:tetratricopeptide (TPR) repeat protein
VLDPDAAMLRTRAREQVERGDLAGADARMAPLVAGDAWELALWRGMRGLLDGRLATCQREAVQAARVAAAAEVSNDERERAARWSQVLLACLRREQGRPAEAEIEVRAAVAGERPAPASVQALVALLVAEMGRDSVARGELDRLVALDPDGPDLVTTALCAEVASVVGLFAEADTLSRLLSPAAHRLVIDEEAAVCHGSVARFLGRLAHVLGRWDEAVAHYERALDVHFALRAPLLVAHTRRQLAAVLRVWGDDDDWERALDHLRGAAAVYRRLGVESLAGEAQAVLGRSDDLPLYDDRARPNVFHRDGDGWVVGVAGSVAWIEDAAGLDDIARLLAAPRTAVHVADLAAGLGAVDPRSRTDRPWYWPQQPRAVDPARLAADVDEASTAAYEARLAGLEAEESRAEAAGDGFAAALARGERDVLAAELAWLLDAGDDRHPAPDPVEKARRAVVTRIRLGLDRIEEALPAAGRHLRAAIRTGTFCSYEPATEVTWQL